MRHGNFYIGNTDECELTETQYFKSWFIVSQLSDSRINKNELKKYANLWYNCNIYDCVYDKIIMDNLKHMESNMYSTLPNFNHQ